MDTTQLKYHEYKFETIYETQGMVLFIKVLSGFVDDNQLLSEVRKRYPENIKCLLYIVASQTVKVFGDIGLMSFTQEIKSPLIIWKNWDQKDIQ